MAYTAFDESKRAITADEAIKLRELAHRKGEPIPVFTDASGKPVFLVRPSNTLLRQAGAHFAHYPTITERTASTLKRDGTQKLEDMLKERTDFSDVQTGSILFYDNKEALTTEANVTIRDSGFDVIYTKHGGKEYALLVLDRAPHSQEYLYLLKYLNDMRTFGEGDLATIKYLMPKDGEPLEIGVKEESKPRSPVYLVTVQLKDSGLWNSHTDRRVLKLGEWQRKHLATLYPDMTFFDGEHGVFGNTKVEGRRDLRTIPWPTLMANYGLEPRVVNAHSLQKAIGSHPRLYLGKVVYKEPEKNLSLELD